MEYQRKKKQILQVVQYSNLLSFSLVQNKLQRNFKSIVQALLLAQSEGNQMKEDLKSLSKSNSKELKALNDRVHQLEKKITQLENRQVINVPNSNKSNQEENKSEGRSFVCISEPKLNVNLIQSIHNTRQDIQSNRDLEKNNKLQQLYNQLKDKLDKLLQDQLNCSDLQKKINSMKDNINLLKAEVKVLADKQTKSAKRVSLGSFQRPQIIQAYAPSISTQNAQKSSSNINPMNSINQIQSEFEKQMNNLHIQFNTMKINLEQLKQQQGQARRRDNKTHYQIQQVANNLKKLDQRTTDKNNQLQKNLDDLKTQLKDMPKPKPISQPQTNYNEKKSKKTIEGKQNISPNYQNQINDIISKLQSTIKDCLTEAEFKRFRNQMKDKISRLEGEDQGIRKQLKEQIQMLTQIIDTKQEQIKNLERGVEQMKNRLNDMASSCERKNHIAISRYDQLKKNLQNLKEDLQFYKSMNESSQPKVIVNTVVQSSNQPDKKIKNQVSGKQSQELKKYINRKLHDQRTYLLGLIRDLQKKSGGKNVFEQDLVTVWDKLGQINLFLNKKANEDDVKKSLAFFQKKLASICQRFTSSDENTQDARIAKTNWFCLSCDKNLHNYQGKVGQHVVWDSLPVKPGYTKYYNKQQKKSLPTLKR